MKGLNGHRLDAFFGWMDGYCEAFADMPDGAWQAACEGAVSYFNQTEGANIDPYDGWMAWVETHANAEPAAKRLNEGAGK